MDETFRSEPCGIENCRSTKFHKASDGFTYCHRGHQVEGEILTQVEDYGVGGSLPGASKKTRKKDVERQEKVSLTLSGSEALQLYLQCFQLVLRHQVKWLVKVKGYPEDLEVHPEKRR